jgi:hypothetical protein
MALPQKLKTTNEQASSKQLTGEARSRQKRRRRGGDVRRQHLEMIEKRQQDTALI